MRRPDAAVRVASPEVLRGSAERGREYVPRARVGRPEDAGAGALAVAAEGDAPAHRRRGTRDERERNSGSSPI
jgi:hypothetical protein